MMSGSASGVSVDVNINPTVFNVLSDILGLFIRAGVGVGIAYSFTLIVSMHLKHLHNDRHTRVVPIDMMGNVPSDVFEGFHFWWRLGMSGPTFFLLLVLVFADFSHSIADIGMEFVSRMEVGEEDYVLSLRYEHRNPQPLLQISGDPLQLRTVPRIDSSIITDEKLQSELAGVAGRLLRGTDNIARSSSPFLDVIDSDNREMSWYGASYRSIFQDDGTPVATMDMILPVSCFNNDHADVHTNDGIGTSPGNAMVEVPQRIETSPLFDPTIRSVASVPNCTFAKKRDTGIHPDYASKERIETLELAFPAKNFKHSETDTYLTLSDDNSSSNYNNTREFYNFSLSSKNKVLARDRDNWRAGRRIEGVFDGIRIGALQIKFGAIVLASGPEAGSGIGEDNDQDSTNIVDQELFQDGSISFTRRTTYMFVAEILGSCPSRPSGLSIDDGNVSCIAFVEADCDTFEEDYQSVGGQLSTDSPCEMRDFDILWGRNFVADAELVAVVAGMFGRVRPSSLGDTQFYPGCIQAAMFALGTLDKLPRIEQKVVARINMIYFVFMISPLILSGSLVVWSYMARRRQLNYPRTAWELMVFGKEQEGTIIATRPDHRRGGKFPKDDPNLAIKLLEDRDDLVLARDPVRRIDMRQQCCRVSALCRSSNKQSVTSNNSNAAWSATKDGNDQTDGRTAVGTNIAMGGAEVDTNSIVGDTRDEEYDGDNDDLAKQSEIQPRPPAKRTLHDDGLQPLQKPRYYSEVHL